MNEKNYREKHGIQTKKIHLNEIHCSPRKQKWINEYQEIVTSTKSMTQNEWQQSNVFSVVMMTLHSFKTAFYLIYYLIDYHKVKSRDFLAFFIKYCDKQKTPFFYENLILTSFDWTENILNGKGGGVYIKEYSDVYLDIEEVAYINISKNFEKFYSEILLIVKEFLGESEYSKNKILIEEIIEYQKLRMSFFEQKDREYNFTFNIPEYFFKLNSKEKIKIEKKRMKVGTTNLDTYSSLLDFTKRKIIWGRKSDKIKNELDYEKKLFNKIKKEKLNLHEKLFYRTENKPLNFSKNKINLINLILLKLRTIEEYDFFILIFV